MKCTGKRISFSSNFTFGSRPRELSTSVTSETFNFFCVCEEIRGEMKNEIIIVKQNKTNKQNIIK